jgi:uncharacterized protein
MPGARAFQVMTKPIGPKCNLDCSYCYYTEKGGLYPDTRDFRMDDATLETFVRDYMASQVALGVPEIWFSWQGGEPTLLGPGFFRHVVDLQARHAPAGITVHNALQTNGISLDAEWAAFFKDNGFLIGLSIDGPRDLHDRYRRDHRGGPSFDRVMQGLAVLRDGGVDFNALTVVHRHNARRARDVYRFLRDNGIQFMQFIPLVERWAADKTLAGAPQPGEDTRGVSVTPWSVQPKAYGDFLCAVFDEWMKADVGQVFVQVFDVMLGIWTGQPAGLCWFAETCGQGMALEHNGDLYACDHYVYPAHRLGNINETPLEILANGPEQVRFGEDKHNGLPRYCQECSYLFACYGGCPKHRFTKTPDGEAGLNYFCQAYKRFFAHIDPHMRTMAGLLARGQPPALISGMGVPRTAPTRKVGRNEPCPCGSGRKFKACCGSPSKTR